MALSNKTTICTKSIPADVLSKRCLKVIVLSTDEKMAQMADSATLLTPVGVERCVVWIKDVDRAALLIQIPDLTGIDSCAVFSLSTKNKVGMVLDSNSTIVDLDFDIAFVEAGNPTLN